MSGYTTIVITGASSGLGKSMAMALAGDGVTLHICGRDKARLEETAKKCREAGAEVYAKQCDVTDKNAMNEWLSDITPCLLIVNAGISGGTSKGAVWEKEQKVAEVNVMGVMHTLTPLLPNMQQAGRGHVVLIGSLAGLRGMPGAPAYSASKAYVKAMGEALRGALRRHNINVTLVMPGFFESRITDANDFSMPMFMSTEKATHKILKKLNKKPKQIAFPYPLYWLSWFLGTLHHRVSDWIFSKLPEK